MKKLGKLVMKSIRFQKVIGSLLFCSIMAASHAEGVNSVIIDISAKKMSADEVEVNIADPIEVLIGSLEDVLLISAKYSDSRAEITVKFDHKATLGKGLVERVRKALDTMETMPDSIISLSVSRIDDTPKVIEKAVPKVENNQRAGNNKIRPAQERSFAGNYLGTIQSSNEFVPIITRFNQLQDRWGAPWLGQYQMSEAKRVVTGKLSSCLVTQDYFVDCRWQDRYGQGDVSFHFTDDFERFKAQWKIDRLRGEFKWSGAKVQLADN